MGGMIRNRNKLTTFYEVHKIPPVLIKLVHNVIIKIRSVNEDCNGKPG